jgi:hypothetical protein
MLESSRVIADTARDEGQDLGELLLYPNYAMVRNPVGALYGGNEGRIEELRRRYDPVSCAAWGIFEVDADFGSRMMLCF